MFGCNRTLIIFIIIILLAIVVYFLYKDKIKSFRQINNFTDKEV